MTINTNSQLDQTVLAGGCFWCLEAVFDQVIGVTDVVSGYSGGHHPIPSYEQVCTGLTGHAESVQITFDPASSPSPISSTSSSPSTIPPPSTSGRRRRHPVPLRHLLRLPGPAGDCRRRHPGAHSRKAMVCSLRHQVLPLDVFLPAEDYHQEYFAHHPDQGYCTIVIAPKVAKFRQKYEKYLSA